MKLSRFSLIATALLAGCTTTSVTRSGAFKEAGMLFETICMAGLGTPSRSAKVVESSGLEKISNSSDGGNRYFSARHKIYVVTGTRVAEFNSAGRRLGEVQYDYCYVASLNLSREQVGEIQSQMAAKYINGKSAFKIQNNGSHTRLTANERIAGRVVYIVSGQPPTQPAGRKYSSVELQQAK